MTSPATTPPPPYYAVIFTSRRNEQPGDGYAETADRIFALAHEQPGFLGFDTARTDGLGITVCYWKDLASIVHRRLADGRGASAGPEVRT